MAVQGWGVDVTRAAGAALASSQFCFVKINASGFAVAAGAGENAFGILQNDPDAASKACTIRVLGLSKVLVGSGGVTVGDDIASDTAGKAKTAVKGKTDTSNTGAAADALLGSYVLGTALETGVSGDIIQMLVTPKGVVPTTAS